MRHTPNIRVERFRAIHPTLGPSESGENWGYFEIPQPLGLLRVVAADGTSKREHGWEHVSISLENRTPSWAEMCFVKDLFWSDDETVLQFHPRKAAYVNIHPHVLHLWRRRNVDVELPPSQLI